MSNMVPKKDPCTAFEKRAERKTANTTPAPPNKHADFGKLIVPSKNLAIAQKITHKASPTTRSTPLAISTEILVKGKKKNGINTITKKRETRDSLSNVFERM